MSYPVAYLGLATLLLVAAAGWDVRRRRIPNSLNLLVALTGLGAQALARGGWATLSGLAAGLAAIALLWRPWLKGRVGGGDVKVAGAAGVWVGVSQLPIYALVTAAAGGVVAGLCYLASGRTVRRDVRQNLLVAAASATVPEVPIRGGHGRVSVPYGVAVAAGALIVLWMENRW